MHHDLVEQFNAGTQVRFGGNQCIKRKQTVDEHTCGVIRIIKHFHEGCPKERLKLYEDADEHDLGEGGKFGVGDLSYLFKILNPIFAKKHKELEDDSLAKVGIKIVQTDVERHWLKMADMLDAVSYMTRQLGGHILEYPEFIAQIERIYGHAEKIPQHDLPSRIATYINALREDNQYQRYIPPRQCKLGWFKRWLCGNTDTI